MPVDYSDYKQIKAESFWGAIASLILFQIFGFLVFQAFVYYLDNPFMLIYGSIWILAFLFFQSKMIAKIRVFLSKQSVKTATLSLRQIDDWIKFTLTINSPNTSTESINRVSGPVSDESFNSLKMRSTAKALNNDPS